MKSVILAAAFLALVPMHGRCADQTHTSEKDVYDPWACLSTPRCEGNPRVVGKCSTVRGRMNYWNGTPSTRIWIIGTHRMLGLPCEDAGLPENIRSHLSDFDDEVTGSFRVCPLQKYRKGEMQMVCVESVSNEKFGRARR